MSTTDKKQRTPAQQQKYERQLEYLRIRYHTDEEFRKKKQEVTRETYRNNPEYAQKLKDSSIRRAKANRIVRCILCYAKMKGATDANPVCDACEIREMEAQQGL